MKWQHQTEAYNCKAPSVRQFWFSTWGACLWVQRCTAVIGVEPVLLQVASIKLEFEKRNGGGGETVLPETLGRKQAVVSLEKKGGDDDV